MGWRTWLFETLDPELSSLLPGGIHSSIEETPATKPFAVVRIGSDSPEVHPREGAVSTTATIWVHDEPGSYLKIDEALEAIRDAIQNRALTPSADVIDARWSGDSPDLADDFRKTIVRNTSYLLVGRR